MKTILRISLPFFLLLGGCATTDPLLFIKRDPAKGITTTGVIRNRLIDVEAQDNQPTIFYLGPQCIADGFGHEKYQYLVQLKRRSKPYVIIKPGRTLLLVVDGRRMIYATRVGSGPRRTKAGGFYSESAIFDNVHRDDLDAITRARSVKVKVVGMHTVVFGKFSEQTFAAFESVLDHKHVPALASNPDASAGDAQ